MCEQHKFVFEFDKAYNHQLIEKFEASPAHPLSEEVAPAKIGVYALYWKDRLVYAGKALQTTLRRRLTEHTRKIRSRQRIRLEEMTCRFLDIDGSWFVRAAEDALITHYNPDWNLSGFGRHDPRAVGVLASVPASGMKSSPCARISSEPSLRSHRSSG